MTAPERAATVAEAPYLPPGGHAYALMTVDARWSALGVPLDWGLRVLATLDDAGGPVFQDLGLCHVVWPLPSGAVLDWPDLSGIGVVGYGPGARLLVPQVGKPSGTCWLWSPETGRLYTDPATLRDALEAVIGPLDEALAKGPVSVCHYCDAVVTDAVLVAWTEQENGPGWSEYACQPCAKERGLKEAVT